MGRASRPVHSHPSPCVCRPRMRGADTPHQFATRCACTSCQQEEFNSVRQALEDAESRFQVRLLASNLL